MLFASQHPDKVEKLLVIDIAPKSYPIHHQVYIDAMRFARFRYDQEQRRGRQNLDAACREFSPFASSY